MNRKLLSIVSVLALFVALIGFSANQVTATEQPTYKQISAPPTDFANLQLPNPADHGVRSYSAMLPVTFEGKTKTWNGEIAIDSAESATLLAIPPAGANWDIQLVSPTGRSLDLSQKISTRAVTYNTGDFGMGDNKYPAQRFALNEAEVGTYRISITADTRGPADGYLFVANKSSDTLLYTHMADNALLTGSPVTVRSFGITGKGELNTTNTFNSATVRLITPDGTESMHKMASSKNGSFEFTWNNLPAGTYTMQVTANGADLIRTNEHVFTVVNAGLNIDTASKTVARSAQRGEMLRVQLPVSTTREFVKDGYIVSAELWGTNGKEMVPVTWTSGIKEIVNGEFRLDIDARWIALANATTPFELRNIRIQDRNSFTPISQADTIALDLTTKLPTAATRTVTAVTDDMLMGKKPAVSETRSAGTLMLVHGYCSSDVWNEDHFTGNVDKFLDLDQNRSHDQFARKIRDEGNSHSSFGIVAHSQGGAASLHLYTYYWSGLDYSSGNRLVQSVGTPYQGTSLAGNLALLGDLFGVGCGTNTDLTYSGAANWLASIPSWARDDIYFATTSFTDKWWRPDWCNIASDVVLSDPDDGTTEKWAGQLSGGNNLGHKTGWCHTDGMRDDAQYKDTNRNSNMSANAAR